MADSAAALEVVGTIALQPASVRANAMSVDRMMSSSTSRMERSERGLFCILATLKGAVSLIPLELMSSGEHRAFQRPTMCRGFSRAKRFARTSEEHDTTLRPDARWERSDHLERVAIRQRLERCARQGLVPERDRGGVVLQGQVAALPVVAPAERLDGDLEARLEPYRIHDVPAVQAKALLGAIDTVGPDHLAEARIGSREFGVGVRLVGLADADVEVVGAAEIILGAGAADGRELLVVVDEELDLAFAPPAGVVAAPGHVGADIV